MEFKSKQKVVIIICFFSLFKILFSLENLRFYREDLRFSIKNQVLYVEGEYYLRNLSDEELKTILIYPFPQDSLYVDVDSIVAYNIKDNMDSIASLDSKKAIIRVRIPPSDSAVYFISYKQEFVGNLAEYILTTTKEWGRALAEANYSFTIDKKRKIKSFSYIPDNLVEQDEKLIFYWTRKSFKPDKNMIFELLN